MTRALIVGGGISGLATALSLGRQGIEVDLVERDAEIHALGSGITLIYPAVRALDRLGVLDDCLDVGFGVHEFRIFDPRGDQVDGFPLPSVGPNHPGLLGMMRTQLYRILADRATAEGVTVRTGVSPIGIEHGGATETVTFASGDRADYDLVVGADGVRSTVRGFLHGNLSPTPQGQGCFRVVLKRPPDMTYEAQFVGAGTTMVGFTPCDQDSMYMYCLHPSDPTSRLPRSAWVATVRELLTPFKGVVGELRETIVDPATVNYTQFEWLIVPKPWHRGRTVLVGDSAHSTTAQLAAGGAMCLEDAVTLAEELARAATIDDALAAYSDRRYDRCKFVVDTSVQLSTWQIRPDTPGADHQGTMAKAFARLAEPF